MREEIIFVEYRYQF